MEAIALYCELDRQWEVAEVLASLAYRHWFLSDYEGAKELMEKSRGIRRRACCWPTCTARNTMYQGPEARPLIASSTLDALLPTAKPIVVRRSRSLVQAEKAIALAPEAAYLLFLAWLVLMVTIGGAFHLLNRRIDDLSLSLPSPETVLLPDGIVPAVNCGCYPRSGPAAVTSTVA